MDKNTRTEKLYLTNSYTASFQAAVLSCDTDERGRLVAVLNKTHFYPDSGGQPSDRGSIGGVSVLDVWEEVAANVGGLPRFSLAHAEFISERNLERARDLGVGIAVQDRMVYRDADSITAWGASVVSGAPPLRDILEAKKRMKKAN